VEEMKTKETVAKRLYRGTVVSDKMEKTVVVEHRRTYRHAETSKIMETVKKYKVHDEKEEASVGDVVEFYEGRPASKTKYMYLARICNK
jgi:small subunit ribosomal protein S17